MPKLMTGTKIEDLIIQALSHTNNLTAKQIIKYANDRSKRMTNKYDFGSFNIAVISLKAEGKITYTPSPYGFIVPGTYSLNIFEQGNGN
jgi:hypothetical protein